MPRRTKKELEASLRSCMMALKEANREQYESDVRYAKNIKKLTEELDLMTVQRDNYRERYKEMCRTMDRAAGTEYGFKEAIEVLADALFVRGRGDGSKFMAEVMNGIKTEGSHVTKED